jgi:hypothetical protein
MTFAEGLDELNILLGDTDDFTFTPEEKTRALTEAWRDRYVVQPASNTSTYDSTVRAYTFSGVGIIRELQYNTTDNWPRSLPGDAWELIDGTVYIDYDYRFTIPQGSTLTAIGKTKLDTTDDINDANTNLIEYVFTLAHYNTLKLLGAKKTNRFIKNDTNMNEIIALRRDLQTDIQLKRQALARNFERS